MAFKKYSMLLNVNTGIGYINDIVCIVKIIIFTVSI